MQEPMIPHWRDCYSKVNACVSQLVPSKCLLFTFYNTQNIIFCITNLYEIEVVMWDKCSVRTRPTMFAMLLRNYESFTFCFLHTFLDLY